MCSPAAILGFCKSAGSAAVEIRHRRLLHDRTIKGTIHETGGVSVSQEGNKAVEIFSLIRRGYSLIRVVSQLWRHFESFCEVYVSGLFCPRHRTQMLKPVTRAINGQRQPGDEVQTPFESIESLHKLNARGEKLIWAVN